MNTNTTVGGPIGGDQGGPSSLKPAGQKPGPPIPVNVAAAIGEGGLVASTAKAKPLEEKKAPDLRSQRAEADVKKQADINAGSTVGFEDVRSAFSAIVRIPKDPLKEQVSQSKAIIDTACRQFSDKLKVLSYNLQLQIQNKPIGYKGSIDMADKEYARAIDRMIEKTLIRQINKLNKSDPESVQKAKELRNLALTFKALLYLPRDMNGILEFHNGTHSENIGRTSGRLLDSVKDDLPNLRKDETVSESRAKSPFFFLIQFLGDWHDRFMTYARNFSRLSGKEPHQCEGYTALKCKDAQVELDEDIKIKCNIKIQADAGEEELLKGAILNTCFVWEPKFNAPSNGGDIFLPNEDSAKRKAGEELRLAQREKGEKGFLPIEGKEARIDELAKGFKGNPSALADEIFRLPYKAIAWADIGESTQIDWWQKWVFSNTPAFFLEEKLPPQAESTQRFHRLGVEGAEPLDVASPEEAASVVKDYITFINNQCKFPDGRAALMEERIYFPLLAMKKALEGIQKDIGENKPRPEGWPDDFLDKALARIDTMIDNFQDVYCVRRGADYIVRRDATDGIKYYRDEVLAEIVKPNLDRLKALNVDAALIKLLPEGNAKEFSEILSKQKPGWDDLMKLEEILRKGPAESLEIKNALGQIDKIKIEIGSKLNQHLMEARNTRWLPKGGSAPYLGRGSQMKQLGCLKKYDAEDIKAAQEASQKEASV